VGYRVRVYRVVCRVRVRAVYMSVRVRVSGQVRVQGVKRFPQSGP